MRVLMSGYHNPHYWTVTEYMERAIGALGHDLVTFDDGARPIPGRIRDRVRWAERADLAWMNHRLLAVARQVRPDVLIVSGGELIVPETVRCLRREGMTTILWTIDAPRRFETILAAAPFYDHVFCQGTEAVEILSNAGVTGMRWLPMACDPQLHRPEALSDEERRLFGHNIVFVGSWYSVREALFEALADLDFVIWGPGWGNLRSGSPLRNCLQGGTPRPQSGSRSTARAGSSWRRTIVIHRADFLSTRRAPGYLKPWPVGPLSFAMLSVTCSTSSMTASTLPWPATPASLGRRPSITSNMNQSGQRWPVEPGKRSFAVTPTRSALRRFSPLWAAHRVTPAVGGLPGHEADHHRRYRSGQPVGL